MIDEVVAILRCPVTLGDLFVVSPEALADLNLRARKGSMRHLGGGAVDFQFEEALSTSDGSITYPVVDGILVLLPALAMVPQGSEAGLESFGLPSETDAAMRFYDEVGWRRSEEGDFADAELFEDLRPVSAEYIHRCHMRVKRRLCASGRFLLDVASGPIQYDEYLTYSERYDYRVCGDISLTALRAARDRQGARGVYIQCDITRLPLKDGAVDGFVSLHTIYHVPADRQRSAFEELERVLATGRSGVVVYSWGARSLANTVLTADWRSLVRLLLPQRVLVALKRLATGRSPAARAGLYFHAHTHGWFRANVATGSSWDVEVWRSVSVPFLKLYIHGASGTRALQRLYRVEERWPQLLARLGQHPMLVFTKTD